MAHDEKGITRRDAMKRMALQAAGIALAPLIANMKVFAAENAEEVIRYNSLAKAGESAKRSSYADYTSYASTAYSSTFTPSGDRNQYSSASYFNNNYYTPYKPGIYNSYSKPIYSSFYSSMARYINTSGYSSSYNRYGSYYQYLSTYRFHANVV